jgi:hypothetical protein
VKPGWKECLLAEKVGITKINEEIQKIIFLEGISLFSRTVPLFE